MSFAAAHESKRVSQTCHECEHLTQLDLARAPGATRHARDAHADLLASKGLEHERACLDRFRAQSHALIGPSSTGEFL